ncbi:uncharacterized protein CC84DRAFT_1176193 [Paraphaeosphaeria sporulosa]|uniref:Uncharacterized protein n=1 Tax=Paraphaeosphaeria sporulosa TaxID=1460663 RepID=A0A177CH79_9PLEO|nr:uncharacterized protein CC84DRAFT_1176193 [Paraphaeosphaeria sporulosa]OAG06140.1 hypothetical protein CC84DRAFT_1176193 [Paraphaeosphaeria sporulosa]
MGPLVAFVQAQRARRSPTDATLITLASQHDEAQAPKRPSICGVQRSAEAEEKPGQADHASICALLDSIIVGVELVWTEWSRSSIVAVEHEEPASARLPVQCRMRERLPRYRLGGWFDGFVGLGGEGGVELGQNAFSSATKVSTLCQQLPLVRRWCLSRDLLQYAPKRLNLGPLGDQVSESRLLPSAYRGPRFYNCQAFLVT